MYGVCMALGHCSGVDSIDLYTYKLYAVCTALTVSFISCCKYDTLLNAHTAEISPNSLPFHLQHVHGEHNRSTIILCNKLPVYLLFT